MSIDAELVRAEDAELALSAVWLDSSSRGIGHPGGGWTIRLPMSSITRLEAKRFDAWPTVGLVAAGVAASWLGWEALGGGSEDNGPPDGSPPVQRSRTLPRTGRWSSRALDPYLRDPPSAIFRRVGEGRRRDCPPLPRGPGTPSISMTRDPSTHGTPSTVSRTDGLAPRPWQVRPFRPGDEASAVALFREAFGRSMSAAFYRWKVVDSPWPVDAASVWVADSDGRVVGQYAGTPMRFWLGGREHAVLHSCDVMTARPYRRKGVLTSVGTAAHEAWARAGVPFVTGLHYGGWGSRRHYLGWTELFRAMWMWRPLRPGSALARQRAGVVRWREPFDGATRLAGGVLDGVLRRRSRGVDVAPVVEPGPELDRLWRDVRDGYHAVVVRDRAWVAYRYARVPGNPYRLLMAWRGEQPVGYLAYRLGRGEDRSTAFIADLFAAPGDDAARAALVRDALSALRDTEATGVRVLVAADTWLSSFLRCSGFLVGRGSYDVSIVPLAPSFPYWVLRSPARWFVTGGDFDVV